MAASALNFARSLTSSATIAKPFPASPALAASTDALSANKLVWWAISLIVWIICDVSEAVFYTIVTAFNNWSIDEMPCLTNFSVFFISSSMLVVISSLIFAFEVSLSIDLLDWNDSLEFWSNFKKMVSWKSKTYLVLVNKW